MLGIQPHRFRIERLLGSCSQLLEVHHRIRTVDALERESVSELWQRHILAVILRRPPQQAEKVDKGFGKKSSIAVSGHADHGPVAAFGKFCAVGRNQQRQMCELWRRAARGFQDEYMLKSV